jgi:hypothetical protein
MIGGAVAEEVAVAETQVFEQVRAGALGCAGVCERFVVRALGAGVSADEALVALTDDVCLASPVAWLEGAAGRGKTCLRMPILTTARTTAFMPALSPPDVRTAIFMARGQGDGV